MESYSIFLCYYFAFLEKQKIRPQYPSNNWLFPGKEPTVKCSSSKHTSPSKKTILFCYYITKIHHHKKRQIKNQATGNNFGPVCFRMGIIWKNLGTPDKNIQSCGFGCIRTLDPGVKIDILKSPNSFKIQRKIALEFFSCRNSSNLFIIRAHSSRVCMMPHHTDSIIFALGGSPLLTNLLGPFFLAVGHHKVWHIASHFTVRMRAKKLEKYH